MKAKIFLSVPVILVALISFSCKKDKANDCVAGAGGNINFVSYLEHHGVNIPNDSLKPDTVWVKFGVADWSNAPSGYNAMFIGEAGENHVHCNGLKCGDYFFYAAGQDTSISMEVKGGIKTSSDGSTTEVIVHIPVTE